LKRPSLSHEPPPVDSLDFETFFRTEFERVGRALLVLTWNHSEAEDLAQEAFVRAYERWDRVGRMESPTGYVYRTALNLSRSRLRRTLIRARRLLTFSSPEEADVTSATVAARDEISRVLARLPSGQREAVVLVEVMGMTAEEAGSILRVKPATVRVRLSRARTRLRLASRQS
jgi:RNA polymerase sigma-70 factor, ECF subfamily